MYYFFAWRDIIEILFLTTLIYHFALWLKKDRQKNLLPYFFGYCFVAMLAWAIQLPVITSLLFLYTPAALMLFIMMHQEALQRNLVALKNITPAYAQTDDWLETLLQSCLVIINKNKSVTCVIENHDRLDEFIDFPLLINADMRKGILELLLETPSYDHHKMIWADTHGRLRAINATWKVLDTQQTTHQQGTWHEHAMLYSTQTDALVFHVNPITRNFTIIVHNKQFDNVTAHHALKLIQKHITPSKETIIKGDYREASSQNNHSRQRTP